MTQKNRQFIIIILLVLAGCALFVNVIQISNNIKELQQHSLKVLQQSINDQSVFLKTALDKINRKLNRKSKIKKLEAISAETALFESAGDAGFVSVYTADGILINGVFKGDVVKQIDFDASGLISELISQGRTKGAANNIVSVNGEWQLIVSELITIARINKVYLFVSRPLKLSNKNIQLAEISDDITAFDNYANLLSMDVSTDVLAGIENLYYLKKGDDKSPEIIQSFYIYNQGRYLSHAELEIFIALIFSIVIVIWLIKMLMSHRYYKKIQHFSKQIEVISKSQNALEVHLDSYPGEFDNIVSNINDLIEVLNICQRRTLDKAGLEAATKLLNAIPVTAYLKDASMKYLVVNQHFCEAAGVYERDVLGKTDFDLFPKETAELYYEYEHHVLTSKKAKVSEIEVITDKGDRHFLIVNIAPLKDSNNDISGIVGVKIDVSDIHHAETYMELSAKILENTAEGVMVTDANSRIIRVNQAYTQITGYSEAELIGKVPLLLQSGHSSKLYKEIRESLDTEGSWLGELWSCRKNGETYPEMISIKAIYNKEGDVTNYFSMSNDITERKEWEQQLYKMAHYDVLTGLPNRVLFKDRLEQELMRCQRTGKHIGLLYLDLDVFKSINDSLGHAAGDILLVVVAERVSSVLRSVDSVARMGGDEFTVLITDLGDDYQRNMGYLSRLCEKILDVIAEPVDIEGHEIMVTASIGATIFPTDAESVDELFRNADTAMYHAKEQGRKNYQFYSSEFNKQAVERLELDTKLRRAIKNNEIEVYFQPQVDVISGRVVGAEAMIRWIKDGKPVISPFTLITMAEEIGLIYDIGDFVLKEACEQCRRWNDLGHNVRVSVNLSARQFQTKDLVEKIENTLIETQLKPKMLELEVTESAIMQDMDAAIEVMNKLNARGVRWSLDDFGTGYSSLTYLRRFPVDVLKVDQSFVREITLNPEDKAIVKTIIELAHQLHLTVIAEGVEYKTQLTMLAEMKCEQVQGYFYSKPISKEEFIVFMQQH